MTSSVVLFTQASAMLAEADTLQKAKELKNLALTAAEWAKRKGMGEEAIQYCRSYALEAEKRMGELMLAEAEAGRLATRQTASPGGRGGKNHVPAGNMIPATTADLGITRKERAEAQRLAVLPAERFEALRAGTVTKKEAMRPTHVGHNSGETEWYTPPEYTEAACSVMGSIVLDPASSAKANETVKAERYYDKKQNGLAQKWNGNVWLNPPYAQPVIAQFASAVAEKFTAGEIDQACVLVNNATETEWFGRLASVASAICFPSSRIKYLDASGAVRGTPLQGQAVLYMGKRRAAFCDTFKQFGFCVHVV